MSDFEQRLLDLLVDQGWDPAYSVYPEALALARRAVLLGAEIEREACVGVATACGDETAADLIRARGGK